MLGLDLVVQSWRAVTCARFHSAVAILVHEHKSSSGEIRAVVGQIQQ